MGDTASFGTVAICTMAVNIRKFVVRASRMADLVKLGSLSPQAAAFLDASIRAGLTILVAGGMQAGKTTNCQYT